MANAPAPAPPSGQETVIRSRVRNPGTMRWLNLIIAIVAALLLIPMVRQATSFSGFDMKYAWLIGTVAAMGLTALVEALFPRRIHLFISSWSFNTMAASFLLSYGAGGSKWLGWAGLAMLVMSFVAAVVMTSKANEIRLGDDAPPPAREGQA